MKNAFFWDVAPCGSCKNGRFGRTCRLYLQRRIIYRLTLFLARVYYSTLKMEATRSSETSVFTRPTRRHIQEDGLLRYSAVYMTSLCFEDIKV
jgi:hypothetical protein